MSAHSRGETVLSMALLKWRSLLWKGKHLHKEEIKLKSLGEGR
jgi:hypothetical protein